MTELSNLSKGQFIIASAALNSWTFPTFIRHLEPLGWVDMSMNSKYENPTFRGIIKLVDDNTTEYERSWAWWQYVELDSDGTKHRVWWRKLTSTPRWRFWFSRYSPAKNCSHFLRSMILAERKENVEYMYPECDKSVEPDDVKVSP